jgi:hypothetical protein
MLKYIKNMKKIYVLNINGEKEPFSFRKIYKSARKAGVSKKTAQKIASTIEKEAFPGIETVGIFKRMRELLSEEPSKAAVLRFSLKEAMRKLGPSGFPFEQYIGEIFEKQGFQVKTNQIIPGFCCSYEIDFWAEKKNLIYIGECKYRNLSDGKVHSDIALSAFARFLDIQKGGFFNKNGFKSFNIKNLIITNTKFTDKTIKYAECVGIELLGWQYPLKAGLEKIIDKKRLYPITILPSFKRELLEFLVQKRMMLVGDIFTNNFEKAVKKNKITINNFKQLKEEANLLLE